MDGADRAKENQCQQDQYTCAQSEQPRVGRARRTTVDKQRQDQKAGASDDSYQLIQDEARVSSLL